MCEDKRHDNFHLSQQAMYVQRQDTTKIWETFEVIVVWSIGDAWLSSW